MSVRYADEIAGRLCRIVCKNAPLSPKLAENWTKADYSGKQGGSLPLLQLTGYLQLAD
jgi:hypothetical protein